MMNWAILEIAKIQTVARLLMSPGSILSLPQLVVAFGIALAFLAYRQIRRRGSVRLLVILRATLRRNIFLNRSTYADLFYAFVNTFAISGLIGWAMISGLSVSSSVTHSLRSIFGGNAPSTAPDWLLRAGATFLLFITYEFAYYVDHYLNHKIPFLWEFHKVHHTAEVLTPLTVFRVHPIDTLIFVNIVAVIVGFTHGTLIYAIGKNIDIFQIDGSNVITVVCLFSLGQLQHSQFWIPFTGLGGRVLLSPAHHQIHHSTDPAHYDSNLGSFLAVWDWIFGTLFIPAKESPRLRFGVVGGDTDPHRISGLMIDPTLNAFRALRPAWSWAALTFVRRPWAATPTQT